MKKIIAIGASNSQNSINKTFASWAAHQVEEAEVEVVDLNDFEFPLYGIDREKEDGVPEKAIELKEKLKQAQGIVISFAEHNGSYTVAFKNTLDWISRVEKPIWPGNPMLLLSTSPGGRGGRSVLEAAKKSFPHQGAMVCGTFSLPHYHDNFELDQGILDQELVERFKSELSNFEEKLSSTELRRSA